MLILATLNDRRDLDGVLFKVKSENQKKLTPLTDAQTDKSLLQSFLGWNIVVILF